MCQASLHSTNYRANMTTDIVLAKVDRLRIGDIWFTENHNLSGDIPEGLEDKAVIKITKVTLVSENVSFRDGTNTDIIRSTQDLKRVHIEYEVTNIDETSCRCTKQRRIKQFIGGE